MDAISEQIIPTDEWPGGKDAGVTNFIDKQLIGPYLRFQETYRKGLKLIRETCESAYKKRFEELAWDEQTLFLVTMESGKMDRKYWEEGFDRLFFGLIRNHSMQGYYGSPRHGGNRGNISYQMLRLDYPVIIGQNRYN
jgi:gluconate 2-dehydrogenase gamma chain